MTSHVTLGRRLTRIAGVEVDVTDDGTDARLVRWADGPIVDRMRTHVAVVLADLRRRDPGGQALVLRRDATPRGWAARAIAAQRKGALA
ncbi:hypothetical protein, partial [Streptomyces sp. SID3343]|uniref:hypothetical protein n=1 Tax=Streptomyces sp. SID3343 TaxID=2690260 RepID=UPI00136A30FE